jgi:hypothetical protein
MLSRSRRPGVLGTLTRRRAALSLHELVELLPTHPVAGTAIARQPVDGAFAYLELAELGVVTPYDEGHVRMEHESSGEIKSDFMGCHKLTVASEASISSHWNA